MAGLFSGIWDFEAWVLEVAFALKRLRFPNGDDLPIEKCWRKLEWRIIRNY